MTRPRPAAPVTAAWRVLVADLVAGGMISRLRDDRTALRLSAGRALRIVAAVLADPGVRTTVDEGRRRYWADQYAEIAEEVRP